MVEPMASGDGQFSRFPHGRMVSAPKEPGKSMGAA